MVEDWKRDDAYRARMRAEGRVLYEDADSIVVAGEGVVGGETGPMSDILKKAIKDHLAAMEAADKTGDYLDSVLDIARKHAPKGTP
jgi:hypothetical protein